MELERGAAGDFSPPSDNVIFDNQCYATTPSSSNGNSDPEQAGHHYGRHRHMHPHPQVNYVSSNLLHLFLWNFSLHRSHPCLLFVDYISVN